MGTSIFQISFVNIQDEQLCEFKQKVYITITRKSVCGIGKGFDDAQRRDF